MEDDIIDRDLEIDELEESMISMENSQRENKNSESARQIEHELEEINRDLNKFRQNFDEMISEHQDQESKDNSGSKIEVRIVEDNGEERKPVESDVELVKECLEILERSTGSL